MLSEFGLISVTDFLYLILIMIISYLLGSLSFSIISTKILSNNLDIRNVGSGNAGLTNVLRSAGKLPAAITFLGDFLKGIIAIKLTYFVLKNSKFMGIKNFEIIYYIACISGLFCLIGHLYPCFFNFKGGKGVLTSSAIILMINWRVFVCIVLIFIIVLIIFKIVSLASISASILLPLANFVVLFFTDYNLDNKCDISFNFIVISSLLFSIYSLIVVYAHRTNISRILLGTERKIGQNRNNKSLE